MREPEDYRDHAAAAEDLAARTRDHSLRTNFLQLARHWRAEADEAQRAAPKGLPTA